MCETERFCCNVDQPLGSTVMRMQLLEAHRLKVVAVPHYEWDLAASDTYKMHYLRSLLQRHLPPS